MYNARRLYREQKVVRTVRTVAKSIEISTVKRPHIMCGQCADSADKNKSPERRPGMNKHINKNNEKINKYKIYKNTKFIISDSPMTSKEYEQKIKKLAEVMKI